MPTMPRTLGLHQLQAIKYRQDILKKWNIDTLTCIEFPDREVTQYQVRYNSGQKTVMDVPNSFLLDVAYSLDDILAYIHD